MTTAEQRLAARGISLTPLRDEDFQHDDPDILAITLIDPQGSGDFRVTVYIRADLSGEEREGVADWVEDHLERFRSVGPIEDGWQRRISDGGWQQWLRKVPM